MSSPVPPTPPTPDSSDGSPLPPRWLAKLKLEVEGYDLLERIGEGGQASVYKARRQKDQKLVAIKILHAGPHATDEARARLKRETAALMAINHPNIVHALAAGRTRSGLDCLVMNFIDGRPLDDLWEDPAFAAAVLPSAAEHPAAVLRLFQRICETVQAAHVKGITHRDLSPSNILIDAKGQPHILDFGMASTAFDGIVGRDVTVTGQFIGKLKYASPEQAKGANTKGTPSGNADIRSDVYALGVMLYQLLTSGAFPYEVVGNVLEVLHNIIHSAPKRPSEVVPPAAAASGSTGVSPVYGQPAASNPTRKNPPLVNEAIEAIVLKALEKNPDQRYQSAGELAADIDRYLRGLPTSASVWATTKPIAASPMPIAASPMPAQPAPTNTKPNSPFPRRAAYAAAAIILMSALGGIAMNAKSLALWLGMSTVVAPVLPTELAATSPQTAQAAPRPQAADAEGTDSQLKKLAQDLADTDARVRGVLTTLSDKHGVSSPETSDGPASGLRTMDAKAFTEALMALSAATGRTLEFPLPSTDELDAAKAAEAAKFKDDADGAGLVARRTELFDQQAALWAQLAWGTFTGRDEDTLYRYKVLQAADANQNTVQKVRVLEKGILLRRISVAAMNKGLVAARRNTDTPEGDGPALAVIASDVAQQVSAAVGDFLSAMSEAKDKGGLSEQDKQVLAELRTLAEELRTAVNDAPTTCEAVQTAKDEVDRARNRARLQENLLHACKQAAQLDQRLVATQTQWNLQPNTDVKAQALPGSVAKPKPQPKLPRSQPNVDQAIVAVFVVGDKWTGTFTNSQGATPQTWTVTQVVSDVVSVSTENKYGTRNMKIRVKEGTVEIVDNDPRGVRTTGEPSNRLLNIKVTGKVVDGRNLQLGGNWSFTDPKGNPVHEAVSYDLTRAAAAADPLEPWQPGSRWTTLDQRGNLRVWKVVTRSPRELQIERPSDSGQGTVRLTLLVTGTTVQLTQVAHVGTKRTVMNRDWQGKGTIGPKSLSLDYSVVSDGGPRWDESMKLKPE
jgi:serine/threonine protein kinase